MSAYKPTALDHRASESSHVTALAHHSTRYQYQPVHASGGGGRVNAAATVNGGGGGGGGGAGGGHVVDGRRSTSSHNYRGSDTMPSGDSSITIEEEDELVQWVCFDEHSCCGGGRLLLRLGSRYTAGCCLLARAVVAFVALFLAAVFVSTRLLSGERGAAGGKEASFYIIAGAVVSLLCCGRVLWQYLFLVSSRRHPAPIVYYRTLVNFCYAVTMVSTNLPYLWVSE